MLRQIFCYGTLMDADVRRAVFGFDIHNLNLLPATLAGYSRKTLRQRTYPGLVEAPGKFVEGIVLKHVDDKMLMTLKIYEGREYVLDTVKLEIDKVRTRALTFLPAHSTQVSNVTWCLNQWKQTHKSSFLRTLCA